MGSCGLFLALLMTLSLHIMVEAHRDDASYLNYTSLTGFFLQDDPATNASTFDYVNYILLRPS